MIDDLQRRFEEKAYQESKMYYRLTDGLFPGEFYRACIVNFQNFAKNYPDSRYNEELAYKLVEVSSAYAERSVFNKKEERLNQSLGFAESFKRKFPESTYTGKVTNLTNQTMAELTAHLKLKQDYEARTAAAREAAEEEKRNKEASEALRNAENNIGNQ